MGSQSWDPERYERNARFVADLGMPVVELLAPQPDERILDVGCGDGALTEKLVEMGCHVIGVDASPEQIAAAQKRGLDARVMDCQELDFHREFEAVFTNAALHWMKRPDDVIAGVKRALRPGGRFVGEFGGGNNITRIRAAIDASLRARGVDPAPLNPWYYPTAEEYRQKLGAHGFTVVFISLFDRPTELPGPLTDWLETFAEPYSSALPAGERDAFRAEVQERVRGDLYGADGRWRADYVRLRFASRLSAE